jgi:methionyl-tRNA formyltransferase
MGLDDNGATLTERLVSLGCKTLLATLEQLATGSAKAVPQADAQATYAHKLRKEEASIQWDNSAAYIHNQVRAFFPRSPAYCLYHGQRVRILHAQLRTGNYSVHKPGSVIEMSQDEMTVACGADALAVSVVQLEGKNPMTLRELLNGRPGYIEPGSVLMPAL